MMACTSRVPGFKSITNIFVFPISSSPRVLAYLLNVCLNVCFCRLPRFYTIQYYTVVWLVTRALIRTELMSSEKNQTLVLTDIYAFTSNG